MNKHKIIIIIKDEKPDCAILEEKLKTYLDNFDQEKLKHCQLSIHLPECNIVNFMQKQKKFVSQMIHHDLLFKFNHRFVENDLDLKKIKVEKLDRAGNKDILEENYDEIIFIDTNLQ